MSYVIESVEQLRQVYREPHQIVVAKERPEIDDASRRFIEASTFAVIATVGADGSTDASPRGGDRGFIRVLDERHVAIADLGGNNRLDTLVNIVETGSVGLLVIAPGHTETVRVNGRATITTDPGVLDVFGLPRRPKSAIVIDVVGTYMHCAKSFQRGRVWEPEAWVAAGEVPDGAEIFACQRIIPVDQAAIRANLDASYESELALERTPDATSS